MCVCVGVGVRMGVCVTTSDVGSVVFQSVDAAVTVISIPITL